jgi:hypothetical protein
MARENHADRMLLSVCDELPISNSSCCCLESNLADHRIVVRTSLCNVAGEPMMRADLANEFFVGIAFGCTQTIIHMDNV